jgi:hypothetical protein
MGGRESLPPFPETSTETTNCRPVLLIATIWRFLILALACFRSLPFSDSSGAMTLEMTLAERLRVSLVGIQPS